VNWRNAGANAARIPLLPPAAAPIPPSSAPSRAQAAWISGSASVPASAERAAPQLEIVLRELEVKNVASHFRNCDGARQHASCAVAARLVSATSITTTSSSRREPQRMRPLSASEWHGSCSDEHGAEACGWSDQDLVGELTSPE